MHLPVEIATLNSLVSRSWLDFQMPGLDAVRFPRKMSAMGDDAEKATEFLFAAAANGNLTTGIC